MNNATYPSEDEIIHQRFTAYVIAAIRNQKTSWLSKKSKDAKMLVSLEEMLEYGEFDPAFIAEGFDEENERLWDNSITLESIICNDKLLIGILKLSERERKILNLHLIQKMKHGEIADFLGLKRNTVEQAYSRLIKKLRLHMKGVRDEEF